MYVCGFCIGEFEVGRLYVCRLVNYMEKRFCLVRKEEKENYFMIKVYTFLEKIIKVFGGYKRFSEKLD